MSAEPPEELLWRLFYLLTEKSMEAYAHKRESFSPDRRELNSGLFGSAADRFRRR